MAGPGGLITHKVDSFRRAVLWISHLVANRRENLSDPDLASGVLDESRNDPSAVGINRVGRARRVRTQRLQHPTAFAQFDPNNSRPFGRTKRVLRFPSADIADTS